MENSNKPELLHKTIDLLMKDLKILDTLDNDSSISVEDKVQLYIATNDKIDAIMKPFKDFKE